MTILAACDTGGRSSPPVYQDPQPIYQIPIVVHVLHHGEPLGVGFNLSFDRIARQIEILNEDFRRIPGTRGFNRHPDSADARIEFMLARTDPNGNATDGIHRVDVTQVQNPIPPNQGFDFSAFYGYWDYRLYLNVWVEPWPAGTIDLLLGQATGPATDLPGADLLLPGEPLQAEGIQINSWHFGESDASSRYGLGRTLTHEVGHYLGLLHLWGDGSCETNDYCDDTPPVSGPTNGCHTTAIACDGQPAMTENYMDFTEDACMNVFTQDQVRRMRYVLENSPNRILLRIR